MKHIQKAGAPRGYSQWCATIAGTNKADYRELPATEKQALLAALITEQGALCAYTMRRIGDDSAHVEHIKPESRCRADQLESDLDYGNMIACFPREGMQRAYATAHRRRTTGGKTTVRSLCHRCIRYANAAFVSISMGKLQQWPTIPLH